MKNIAKYLLLVSILNSCSNTNECENNDYPAWLLAKMGEIETDPSALVSVEIYQFEYEGKTVYGFHNALNMHDLYDFYDSEGRDVFIKAKSDAVNIGDLIHKGNGQLIWTCSRVNESGNYPDWLLVKMGEIETDLSIPVNMKIYQFEHEGETVYWVYNTLNAQFLRDFYDSNGRNIFISVEDGVADIRDLINKGNGHLIWACSRTNESDS